MINTTYFIMLILIFIRISSFLVITPVFFPNGTPKVVKATIGMILSFSIIGFIGYGENLPFNNDISFIIAALNEMITGLILGMATSIWFNFIKMAGSFIDLQMGLGMLNMYDPNSKTNTTLVSNLVHWIALLIFFILDGHHMLIELLGESFTVVKVGTNLLSQQSAMVMIEGIISYFVIALKISIPLVIIIIISDIVMGLISRSVPQLNIMILGMPVKLLIGISSFIIALPMIIKIIVGGIDLIPDLMRSIFQFAPLVAIIFSDEKTEEATPKKKADAKKKGQVAKSKEINSTLTLAVILLIVITLGDYIANSFKSIMIYYFSMDFSAGLKEATVANELINLLMNFAKIALPVILPIMVMGIVASIAQTGFLFTGEGLKPSLGKLNPIKGFKNMFSKKNIVDLFKNFIVIFILAYIGVDFVKSNYKEIMQIGNLYLATFGIEFKNLLVGILSKVAMVMFVVAATDYFIQNKLHKKEMKMSKQEIKEESKQSEGDPHIKGKRKQKQREMAMNRMMQAVPDATVVITNPT
ncbi:MAG: flagellar biosynthetic protein FliR, partial [Sarcina sp.]